MKRRFHRRALHLTAAWLLGRGTRTAFVSQVDLGWIGRISAFDPYHETTLRD